MRLRWPYEENAEAASVVAAASLATGRGSAFASPPPKPTGRGCRGAALRGERLGSAVVRRAIPFKEAFKDALEPSVVPSMTKGLAGVLPRLPDWLDPIVGNLLLILPILVLANWAKMTYEYYEDSKLDNEKYEKEKIRKALEYTEKDDEVFQRKDEVKKRKRPKKTALKEVIALDRREEERLKAADVGY